MSHLYLYLYPSTQARSRPGQPYGKATIPSVLEDLKEMKSIATGAKVLVPLTQGPGVVSEIFTPTPVSHKCFF